MFGLLLALLVDAEAHKPSYGGDWDTPEDAFVVGDPAVSIVVYREITCDSPALWLSFDATAGEEVWVQLGTPVIDRLEDYRPSMVVLGPGLPALPAGAVPFEIPAGLGGVVYPGASDPYVFNEPFTGTSSWVLAEDWLTMPEAGPSYLVAWDPEGWTGKLWLAMGVVEDFSDVDFTEAASWGEEVNNFHETGRYEPAPSVEEQACEAEELPDDHDHGQHGHGDSGGCAVGGTAPVTGWVALMSLGLAAVRRRLGE